ncbi:GlxA family transcriptional regulator [Undibacterium pigrum]|uniref:AraC family transcriptional regulator with amidase-like domain n=1 Tax=Undibacterium pigrum TaxID=401470 RepID=A0A318JB57_9BURK|nr:helix-turn-helix domain-containing protein [Undibacterium pigrum]PXX45287.1 AraC family transcriptional regulator with amidase-like domain [Undibacterium pigrum]
MTMKTTKDGIIRIGVLVYPGCLRSGAVMPLDVFNIANTLAGIRPAGSKPVQFEACWVSARGDILQEVDGLYFQAHDIHKQKLDALMVPGIDHRDSSQLDGLLDALAPEQALMESYLRDDGLLISSCSSTSLLARTGKLDGRRATTSWWLSAYFRKNFPQVLLEAEELIVQDGQLVSSGGVTSYIDLSLWLVGHFAGEELRQMTAKILVVDANRNSQAPYVAKAIMQDQGHAVIERARRWLNKRLDQQWAMADLASYCNVSQRTLLRRFQESMKLSPIHYVQQLRVERAKALLETTRLSLEDITTRCGYEDVSSFSKIFKHWAQVTPKDYRRRFGLRF